MFYNMFCVFCADYVWMPFSKTLSLHYLKNITITQYLNNATSNTDLKSNTRKTRKR